MVAMAYGGKSRSVSAGMAEPGTLDESGALFRSFNVTEVPVALVVDGNGRIVRRVEGQDLAIPTALKAAIGKP